jgi:hypothetical protein
MKLFNPLRDGSPDAGDSLQLSCLDKLIKRANKAAQAGRGPHISLGFVGVVRFEGRTAADLLKQVSDFWCGVLRHS